MKRYKVGWAAVTRFYTTVEVPDDADEADITDAAYRNAQHGDINAVYPIVEPEYTIEEIKDV